MISPVGRNDKAIPGVIKTLFFLLLFTTLTIFGQNPLAPEDKIYNTVDAFVANPSSESLQKLEATEKNFWKNPKPKPRMNCWPLWF